MTTREQTISEALDRLFRTYPSSTQGDTAGEILRNRIERVKVYLEAIEPYEVRDINTAVTNFLTGAAPGHNPAFAPAAPQLAAECRRVLNLRLDHEQRMGLKRPRLPPPDVVRSPESQARVKALAERTINDLASVLRTEDAAEARRKSDFVARVHDRFQPDMSDDAVAERLMGWRVGNDGEGEAA